jgi:hypothetical protein
VKTRPLVSNLTARFPQDAKYAKKIFLLNLNCQLVLFDWQFRFDKTFDPAGS